MTPAQIRNKKKKEYHDKLNYVFTIYDYKCVENLEIETDFIIGKEFYI